MNVRHSTAALAACMLVLSFAIAGCDRSGKTDSASHPPSTTGLSPPSETAKGGGAAGPSAEPQPGTKSTGG